MPTNTFVHQALLGKGIANGQGNRQPEVPGASVQAIFRYGCHFARPARDGSPAWTIDLYQSNAHWLGRALATEIAAFPETDALIHVEGTFIAGAERPAIWVRRLTPVLALEPDYCIFDFAAPGCVADRAVVDRARKIWASLGTEYRRFVNALFTDPVILTAFLTAPGSCSHHHAQTGGCFEHCVEGAEIASSVAAKASHLNRDVLVTSVLVHDCGKALEYERGPRGHWRMTSYGRRVGHKISGIQLATLALTHCPGLRANEKEALVHALSCSYAPSWVGLRAPASPEATIAGVIDRLSAEVGRPAWTRG